ncbi:MAG: DUF2490 domain-containing protein [Candidatus Omnitrophica bacterium]|nr:DUF2490 domain-containing protein [Candidatus Omnitrophota bacterium]
MKKRFFLTLTLILAAPIAAYTYDDGDFQVWHTEIQEKEINKESRLTLEEELRFGDDASELYYYYFDIGYAYDVNKNLTLGLNYRQIYDKKQPYNKFKIENRPHINATLKYALSGFQLDDRNRLEYRHFDYQEDSWEYRNKFTVKFPWKFTRLQIQPYLADEIFLKLNGIDLNRNRLYSGFMFTVLKNLKAEIYYLLQKTKSSGKWTAVNVLGSKVKVSF